MKIKSFLKSTAKIVLKIGMAALGITSLLHGDPSGAIALSAAISASVKDKNFKGMKIINVMAGNFDKAKNDPEENK